MEVPQKIKNRTTIGFSITTSWYSSKENENRTWKRYLHSHDNGSVIHKCYGDMETACLPADDCIKKMWHMCMMEEHSAMRKKEFCHCDSMDDLEDIMLSEISQTEKDKYCVAAWYHLYLESKK
ncbi:hypothetical protein HJG60_007987 [Phyllostomus discolor]|uniref:Uncharacterized protein n=1 Tax=Phyllostomus discolor TaxID=89673 RepID=A0A834BNQ2_9CHIR|nr:hypothetical protein HJG60_007987 [Phyllostomus discolor]